MSVTFVEEINYCTYHKQYFYLAWNLDLTCTEWIQFLILNVVFTDTKLKKVEFQHSITTENNLIRMGKEKPLIVISKIFVVGLKV